MEDLPKYERLLCCKLSREEKDETPLRAIRTVKTTLQQQPVQSERSTSILDKDCNLLHKQIMPCKTKNDKKITRKQRRRILKQCFFVREVIFLAVRMLRYTSSEVTFNY